MELFNKDLSGFDIHTRVFIGFLIGIFLSFMYGMLGVKNSQQGMVSDDDMPSYSEVLWRALIGGIMGAAIMYYYAIKK